MCHAEAPIAPILGSWFSSPTRYRKSRKLKRSTIKPVAPTISLAPNARKRRNHRPVQKMSTTFCPASIQKRRERPKPRKPSRQWRSSSIIAVKKAIPKTAKHYLVVIITLKSSVSLYRYSIPKSILLSPDLVLEKIVKTHYGKCSVVFFDKKWAGYWPSPIT